MEAILESRVGEVSSIELSDVIEDAAYNLSENGNYTEVYGGGRPGPITCKGCKPMPQPGCRPPCKSYRPETNN